MCGICGILDQTGAPVDPALLTRMRDTLVHRGPDDAGQFTDGAVGLAMRRLSIIDLESGRQPIFNEDGTIGIVFNGEIYNYKELREGLLERGHRLVTQGDTEVIVHLYEELGDDCMLPLNGMFAFAIWDSRRRRLLLARDRLGIKPLYLAQTPSSVLFASELKAILMNPAVERRVDRRAIREYLTYEYVPAPRSAFQGIEKVPGGTRVVCENGTIRRERYWNLAFHSDRSLSDEAACASQVHDRLKEAVRLQLRSDVPLGVLLSGGIDSSAVVALMHELKTPVESFSIGFAERAYNELDAASEVARRFQSRHHTLQASAEDVRRLLPELMEFLDEPLADASVIPTYLVSRLAHGHVKVALSGDGGDEAFGGYATYKAHRLARYYRMLPKLLRRALNSGVRGLPAWGSHMGVAFRAKKFTRGADLSAPRANALWWGAYTPGELDELLTDDWRSVVDDPLSQVEVVQGEFQGDEGLNRIFHQDLRMYLQDDLLVKVDRMSMAHSLEVRVPFLDHTLVEFAAQIPEQLKVRGLRLKHILRKALAGILPPEILNRPKRGFDIPLGAWLRGPLREFLGDTLSADSIRETGWFRPSRIQALVDEHLAGRHDHRQLLWPLVVLETWRRRYRPQTSV